MTLIIIITIIIIIIVVVVVMTIVVIIINYNAFQLMMSLVDRIEMTSIESNQGWVQRRLLP